MKKFLILLFISSFFITHSIFACSGSCLLCHPKLNLEKPVEHKFITQCISCHKGGCGEQSLSGDKESNTACGSDCFDCHTTLPKDQNHAIIAKCVSCHNKLSVVK